MSFDPITLTAALPTDGLDAEVARIPALLRSIDLGHITLSLERKAAEGRRLLGITCGAIMW